MEPWRGRCSSALGREAIRLESEGGIIRVESTRQLRPAGVYPRRKPERTHIGGCVGKLADQNRCSLIIEAVIILVGEGVLSTTRVAVSEKNSFEPAMRAEACFESAIRGVVNEDRVVGAHGEK